MRIGVEIVVYRSVTIRHCRVEACLHRPGNGIERLVFMESNPLAITFLLSNPSASVGRCVAQRIQIIVIAGGNHSTIQMPPPYGTHQLNKLQFTAVTTTSAPGTHQPAALPPAIIFLHLPVEKIVDRYCKENEKVL